MEKGKRGLAGSVEENRRGWQCGGAERVVAELVARRRGR